MALSHARIVSVGETPYIHERAGIEFIEKALPDTDPYHLWALVDLLDPSTGRLLEVDVVVLGYSCLYLVELKDWPGRIHGNSIDWTWETPEGRRHWRDNPRTLARRKAQILKSRLERELPRDVRAPWVEPLIFLSHPEVALSLEPDGLFGVVRRRNFVEAVTRHEFPGADPRFQGKPIERNLIRPVVQALQKIGFRKRKGKSMVGQYELGEMLDETATYQDREATHSQIKVQRRRARTYLVPEQTSVERKQQLLRAAEREVMLLNEVREHPSILRMTEYVADAPLGPTVLFEEFERSMPLDAFLRNQTDTVTFADRITILEQTAMALGHCHRREIVHGGLCPSAILVRRGSGGAIETRLCNFQLGGSQSVEATSHWSALGPEAWAVYQAPELRRDPTQRTIEGDIFSLGAVGYLLMTGRPPGGSIGEVEARMKTTRCLDPRDASNAIPDLVADAITMATQLGVAERANDTAEWIEFLIAAATAPAAPTEPERSPLTAHAGEQLGAFSITRVLGHGASSRVLEVKRDDSSFALKASLGDEHDERLVAEAAVLAKLRHPRIVRLEERLTIAGRPCLLLSLAGQSLQRKLAEDGTPSLDYANRYGADLLTAVAYLEDEDVLHRDIKPANVGVGNVSKRSQSLTLFDFSLAGLSLTNLSVGTAAYRDPHLNTRGRWDAAADRYSAAITLYELVTGQRPAVDETGNVTLAAERFESSVRSSLVEFFRRAFAPGVAERHASAEQMRRDWERAFEAPVASSARVDDDDDAPPAMLTDAEIAKLPPSATIQSLLLSNRAKNALDRAGILCVGDLRDLPQNRLSAMRGVGRNVAKEILDLRDRWLRLSTTPAHSSEPPFFPGYRGADLMVQIALTELPNTVTSALADAGLRTLSLVAGATKPQIAALAQRHAFDATRIAAALSREHDAAEARDQPSSLDTWIEALLPSNKKYKHVRSLFGLDGKDYSGVRELATATNLTTAAIYIAVGKAKTDWLEHVAIHELVAEVHGALDRAGGVGSLDTIAQELLVRIAHTSDGLRHARALVRVVVECDKDDPLGIRLVRIAGNPWLVRRADLEPIVARLGEIADELAARDILVGPAEAHRTLVEVVADSPLAELTQDRLVRLAASASHDAAASNRLELYPRKMDGRRALELSAAVIPAKITEDKLRELITARYPDATPLPPRPALDDVLATSGLHYLSDEATYARQGAGPTSLHTSVSSYTRMTTSRGPEIERRKVTIHEFDDQIRICLDRRALLILGVSADRAPDAELALQRRFGLAAQPFDRLFLTELDRLVEQLKIDEAVVHQADLEGRTSPNWNRLANLAKRTAKEVATKVLPPKQPLLLTQPGLIDRYDLTEFLAALVEAARADASEAIIVLVPGNDDGARAIGGTQIPDLLPGQFASIPKDWIGAHLDA